MAQSLFLVLILFAAPEPRVVILKNGLVIEDIRSCRTQGGVFRFTDRDGNAYRIPEAWIAHSEPMPQPVSPESNADAGPEQADDAPHRPDAPRPKPLVITDKTLAAYAAQSPVRVTQVVVQDSQDAPKDETPEITALPRLEAQKKLNAQFRAKARQAREKIERIKDQIRRVEDGLFLTLTAEDRDKLRERLTELRGDLEQATRALSDIRRQARRQGAKPRSY